jgi:hypothetical protein
MNVMVMVSVTIAVLSLMFDMLFHCVSGKVDRLRRVNHELLELINERSGNLERALKNYVQDEETIPLYRAESQGSVTKEYSAFKGVMKAADLVPRDINHVGPRPVLPSISSVDPALLSLQQYHITSDISAVNREKANVTAQLAAQMRQDLFGKKVKNGMMTFHSEKDREKDREIDLEGGFSFDNPGLNILRVDTKLNSNRDGTATMSPDEPSPSSNGHRRLRQSASAACLLDLENQREAQNYHAASGNTENTALTMVVTHHVKWERTLEFDNWTKDMFQKM